jgi:hypothetical protein
MLSVGSSDPMDYRPEAMQCMLGAPRQTGVKACGLIRSAVWQAGKDGTGAPPAGSGGSSPSRPASRSSTAARKDLAHSGEWKSWSGSGRLPDQYRDGLRVRCVISAVRFTFACRLRGGGALHGFCAVNNVPCLMNKVEEMISGVLIRSSGLKWHSILDWCLNQRNGATYGWTRPRSTFAIERRSGLNSAGRRRWFDWKEFGRRLIQFAKAEHKGTKNTKDSRLASSVFSVPLWLSSSTFAVS